MIAALSLMVVLGAGPQSPPTPVVAAPAPKPVTPSPQAPAVAGHVMAALPLVPPPSAMVGFWEADATSRGGIGTALLLNADGSCDFIVLLKVDFRYSYEAGKLVFAGDAQGTPETNLEATITGDTMVVKPPAGEPITKTRAGAVEDAARPLLGVWRYPHATGGTAWERYGADGTMRFRMATADRPSVCTVTGDRLAITSPQFRTDARFELAGDELRLSGSSGEARLFRRVADGRWYGKADLTPAK